MKSCPLAILVVCACVAAVCSGVCAAAYGGITARGPYGWAGTSGYIYHQNGPWTGVSRGAAGYNANRPASRPAPRGGGARRR